VSLPATGAAAQPPGGGREGGGGKRGKGRGKKEREPHLLPFFRSIALSTEEERGEGERGGGGGKKKEPQRLAISTLIRNFHSQARSRFGLLEGKEEVGEGEGRKKEGGTALYLFPLFFSLLDRIVFINKKRERGEKKIEKKDSIRRTLSVGDGVRARSQSQ